MNIVFEIIFMNNNKYNYPILERVDTEIGRHYLDSNKINSFMSLGFLPYKFPIYNDLNYMKPSSKNIQKIIQRL